jgi:hypothetical protein
MREEANGKVKGREIVRVKASKKVTARDKAGFRPVVRLGACMSYYDACCLVVGFISLTDELWPLFP